MEPILSEGRLKPFWLIGPISLGRARSNPFQLSGASLQNREAPTFLKIK